MASQAASLKYARNLDYSTAEAVVRSPAAETVAKPVPRERAAVNSRAGAAAKSTYSISLFAITGSMFVAILMIFVVLAQVSYNEVTNQTVKLQAQLGELTEQGKKLEIGYESEFDMNEIERYAKDVLGMVKYESDQLTIMGSVPQDRITIVENGEDESTLGGLGSFLSSLLEYFKRDS